MAVRRPERFKRLLLWQPVTDAKAMLTRFLRLRVAAAMAEGGIGETTEELRAQLNRGQSIEVAGYELAPELTQALDGLRMDRLALASHLRIDWLEVAAEASDRPMPAAQRMVDGWRRAGIAVSTAIVSGDPFWSLQETTLAPALLAATLGRFEPC